ncbi:MAG: alcohol dehydrogenase catalytic domain-containing protein, partial [Planctomycetes bacterium]|nr:alcohol dehydrogenase catalytic domain-containing protein [Planctomycetota bacterium]
MNGSVVVFRSPEEACLEPFEIQPLKPDEVLIKSAYSVISAGTEVANLKKLPNTVSYENGFPHYPGYCGAGYVEAVGAEVEKLKVGDRVIIQWGGHRSHVIKNVKDVFKIQDDAIDLMEASFAHIASFPFLGVRKLKLEIGESVVVAGMGILGAFALQVAALSGAVPVLALDFDPSRRALALKLGAAAAFSPDEEN